MAESSSANAKLLVSEDESENVVEVEVHETVDKKTTADENVNVSETIASGEIKKGDEEKKEGNSNSNIKVEVVPPRKKRSFIKSKLMRKKKTTLLEQALTFREQNPEKWQQRQEDSDKRVNESYGVFDDDPFIEAYYERLAELKVEGEKLEEQRKSAPATLSLQLEFNKPRKSKNHGKDTSNPAETYASMAANGVSIFENDSSFFDMFKSHKDDERGKDYELLITVLKGKNLINALPDEKMKLKNCRLKCKFYPDSLKHGPKLKTAYVHCNKKGTTKWNHVFVLKGFKAEDLATKHVVLELVGKTDEGKVTLGEVVLAGKKARITRRGSDSSRLPSLKEQDEWEQTLNKPGSSVTTTCNISSTTGQEGLSGKLADKMKQEFGYNKNNSNNKKLHLIRNKSRR